MAQVTVYLSDDLAEQARRLKDRLNISQTCAQALRREVRRLMAANIEGDAMEKLVARLRTEKEQATEGHYDLGFDDGKAWAQDAHYTELTEYGEILRDDQGEDEREGVAENFRLPDGADDIGKERDQEERREHHLPLNWTRYNLGWLEGVAEVWEAVKDDV